MVYQIMPLNHWLWRTLVDHVAVKTLFGLTGKKSVHIMTCKQMGGRECLRIKGQQTLEVLELFVQKLDDKNSILLPNRAYANSFNMYMYFL